MTDRRIDILLHEHSNIRAEVLLFTDSFKKHVRQFQLVISAVFGSLIWLITNSASLVSLNEPRWYVLYTIWILINPTCAYLIFDFLHTTYSLIVLGARSRSIEIQIADYCGENLLIWEKISSYFYQKAFVGRLPNPNHFQFVIFVMFVAGVMGVLPYVIYWKLSHLDNPVAIWHPELLLATGIVISITMTVAVLGYTYIVYYPIRREAAKYVSNIMAEPPAVSTPPTCGTPETPSRI